MRRIMPFLKNLDLELEVPLTTVMSRGKNALEFNLETI
jgi:hypothetical protein